MEPKLISGTVEMLILEIISDSPTYGYEITQMVGERSQGYFDLKEGSLYPALHRMERKKLLTSSWKQMEGRRRKYYKLTLQGKKALAAKRQDWQEFAAGVNGVLGASYGLG